MAWTTPRTWVPGELVTANMMNMHVRDNLNYLFNRYAEGVWTPALGGTATYIARHGDYIKIGKQVWFHCHVNISVIGTGNQQTVSGLPFTAVSVAGAAVQSANVSYWASAAGSFVFLAGLIVGTSIQMTGLAAAGASSTNPATVFTSGTDLFMSGTYEAVS